MLSCRLFLSRELLIGVKHCQNDEANDIRQRPGNHQRQSADDEENTEQPVDLFKQEPAKARRHAEDTQQSGDDDNDHGHPGGFR